MNIVLHEARHRVDIAGSTLSYVDAGAGDVVVLAHSYLWDAEMWRPQIDALSRHYRVIVPELWGHGASGALPPGTRDLADIARHNLDLLDRLGIDRFILAGLSGGGMWGSELALLAPERVKGLALLDTSLAVEPEPSRLQYLAMLDMVSAIGQVPAEVIDAIVPMFFSPQIVTRAPELPASFRARLGNLDPLRLRDGVVELGRLTFGRRDTLGMLALLRIPTLVLTGADDIPRPPKEARNMAAQLGCRFVEVPEAGHISTLEAPGAVTAALLEFARRL